MGKRVIICDHPRERWRLPADSRAFVDCKLERLKGTDPAYGNQRATYQLAHNRAKTTFDVDVALDIVERCVQETVLDALADVIFTLEKHLFWCFLIFHSMMRTAHPKAALLRERPQMPYHSRMRGIWQKH
jgi:hypothetical protein